MLESTLDPYVTKIAKRRARAGLPAPQVLLQTPDGEYSFGARHQAFHSASAGKLATTALIMQEVEAGLSLGSLVEEVLPEAQGLFAAPGATIEHLLGHVSGLPDSLMGRDGLIRTWITQPDKVWSPADHIAFVRNYRKPRGLPGEKYCYADVGFILLGRIVETRSGKSFDELLQERIFQPLGMTNSVLWGYGSNPMPIAPAWVNGVEISSFRSLESDWAAGGLATTLDDLVKLARGISDGTLISRESFRLITTPRHQFRRGMWYGLGTMQLRAEGFAPWLRGMPRYVGHLGLLGVHCTIDVASETAIALNFHSAQEMPASVRTYLQIVQALT